MSEFRIIKCKKCDAALTELEGEKLTHCIQCGYQFGGIEKKPNSIFHTRLDRLRRIKDASALKTLSSPDTTKTSNSNRLSKSKPSNRATSTKSNKTSKEKLPVSNKSKAPIWFTIFKWYIIISVVIGIISGIFR